MFCTPNSSDLKLHFTSDMGVHSEASFLFRKYHSVWQSELNVIRSFTEESHERERMSFSDRFRKLPRQQKQHAQNGQVGPELSVHNELEYQQLIVFDDLVTNTLSANTPSPPMVSSSDDSDSLLDSPNQMTYQAGQLSLSNSNQLSITTVKPSENKLVKNNSNVNGHVKTVSNFSTAAREDLGSYLDDKEISVLESKNLIEF